MAKTKRGQVDPFNADDPIMPWEDESAHVAVSHTSPKSPTHKNCWLESDTPEQPKGAGRASRMRVPKRRRTRSSKSANRAVLAIILIFVTMNILGGVASCNLSSCEAATFRSTLDGNASSELGTWAPDWDDEVPYDEMGKQAELELTAFVDRMASGDEELVAKAAGLLETSFGGYSSKTTLAKLGIDTAELATWVLSRAELHAGTLSSYALPSDEQDDVWDVTASGEISYVDADALTYDLARYIEGRLIGNSTLITADGTPTESLAADVQAELAKARQQYDNERVSCLTYLNLEFDGRYDAEKGEVSLELDEEGLADAFDSLFGIYGD